MLVNTRNSTTNLDSFGSFWVVSCFTTALAAVIHSLVQRCVAVRNMAVATTSNQLRQLWKMRTYTKVKDTCESAELTVVIDKIFYIKVYHQPYQELNTS